MMNAIANRKFLTLGLEKTSGLPYGLTVDESVRHLFVCGTTGSGKTELLLGLSASAIAAGSGVLFCDGKGDISSFAKLYALAARFGRQDEIVLVNFLGKKGRTNGLNPFKRMSAAEITQLIGDLMDAPGHDPMWHGRAVALVHAVVPAAVWLRDTGRIKLDAKELHRLFDLGEITDIVEKYPEMPEHIRGNLTSYLRDLPGYDPAKGKKQSQTPRDQHGYLTMQLTNTFGAFINTYASVFMDADEVDFWDIVANGRIAVILLPALAKSSADLSMIGKMMVAMFKNALGRLLDLPVEGDWATVVERRVSTGRPPFLAIFDEVGHYLTAGMGLMAAQARSLNVSLVFGTQDMESMGFSNPHEKTMLLSNCNTKIFLKSVVNDYSFQQNFAVENSRRKAEIEQRENLLRFSSYLPPRMKNYEELQEAADWMVNKAPAYDKFHEQLPGFKSGEMAVLNGNDLVLVKAFHASKDMGRPDIHLNRSVSLDDLLRPITDAIADAEEISATLSKIAWLADFNDYVFDGADGIFDPDLKRRASAMRNGGSTRKRLPGYLTGQWIPQSRPQKRAQFLQFLNAVGK
jgi:hypothetical protein